MAILGRSPTVPEWADVTVTYPVGVSDEEIEELAQKALARLDTSSWIGWHEDGQTGVDCTQCGRPTRGEITLCLAAKPGNVVSVHRDCMVRSLDEGPKEQSQEIIERLLAGGPLFEETT